jgi:predicted dehydrogenase
MGPVRRGIVGCGGISERHGHAAASSPQVAIVACALAETSDRYGTIDRLHGLIEYERGPVGVVASSRRREFDHELRINGAHGRMLLPVAWRIEDSTEVLVQRSVGWGEFEATRHSIAAVDSFRLQLESLATAVRGNGAPRPGLTESLVTAFTLDALLTSAAERAPVSVDLPNTLHAA